MPRRNRNAGAIRLDTDQLAADLAQLAAELRYTAAVTGTGKSGLLIRYLARTITPGSLLTVIDGKQPIPHLAAESR
jgi:hypothetical protein